MTDDYPQLPSFPAMSFKKDLGESSSMVAPKRYTRFIKETICEKLVRDSRNRCCVSRCASRILIPEEETIQAISTVLHRHHLVYYSDGGPPTAENLVVVCPNCHALIHEYPHSYTVGSLLRDKARWIAMADIVPKVLDVRAGGEGEDMIVLPFVIESLNLSYSLRTAASATIFDLTGYVAKRVIAPLGEYMGIFGWIYPDSVELALRSARKMILDPSSRAASISVRPGDALVAIVHRPTVTWQ